MRYLSLCLFLTLTYGCSDTSRLDTSNDLAIDRFNPATQVYPSQLLQRHREAAQRQRRVIFNSDGVEATHLAKSPTVDGFLDVRARKLEGSAVDTISYCSISAGFGLFTHRTTAGEELTHRRGFLHNNITADLYLLNTDPLEIMSQFCRENELELFWSFRVNDARHDFFHREDHNPYPLMPQLKIERPDLLHGDKDSPPPYGIWSAVDYGNAEIRTLAFSFIEEVVRNYDLDGIELDFFRDPVLFKSVSNGGEATQEELDQLTEWLYEVRRLLVAVAAEKEHPFLLAIKVPDSITYCRGIGIDLERWLELGLVDILIVGGDFQLNHWDYSVAIGKKFGVPVYPSWRDAKVQTPTGERDQSRRSDAHYRGRAHEALAAGADGVYIFNEYNAARPYLRQIGDLSTLSLLERIHFASVKGPNTHPRWNVSRWLVNGADHMNKSSLMPQHPAHLAPGEETTETVAVGPAALVPDSAQVTGRIRVSEHTHPGHISVLFNTHPTSLRQEGDWLAFSVNPEWLNSNIQDIQVKNISQEHATTLYDIQITVQ